MRRDTSPLPSHSLGGGGAGCEALAAALDAETTRRLRRVALRITRDPSAADDVVQAALEKALRHAATFRGDARPSTWLHRIVVNEALMWHRGETRRRAQLARVAADCTAEPRRASALDALLAREREGRLARALAVLRPEDADLLVRCTLGTLDYASWARERGMLPSVAKTRAFRARRALRAALEADLPQQQPPPSQGPRVSR
jgi:RNA polymerase sigma-70 factor (ECF subfamily)